MRKGVMPRCLELIHQTVKPLRRLINLKGPTGFRPWTLGRDLGRRRGNIDSHEKLIRSGCQSCRHDALHLLYALSADSLGPFTPVGCQRSSARDAWSTPHDTVQSSDNLESWGTIYPPRSKPLLSYGPHHDPGVQLIIPVFLILIIRAVMRCHLRPKVALTGVFSSFCGQTLPKMVSGAISQSFL